MEEPKDDMDIPSFIMLSRIYDLLTVIALKMDPEVTGDVLRAHERGEFFGAPPIMSTTAFKE